MRPLSLLINGMIGAGLMYFFDPDMGRRRRALLRDQMVKMQNTTVNQAEDMAVDSANRAKGAAAEAMSQMVPEDVPNETLVARVRSEMGHHVNRPGLITVTADNGSVALSGDILDKEVQTLVSKIRAMSGVKHVDNQLTVHDKADDLPEQSG